MLYYRQKLLVPKDEELKALFLEGKVTSQEKLNIKNESMIKSDKIYKKK
jgi:hypothetical protein